MFLGRLVDGRVQLITPQGGQTGVVQPRLDRHQLDPLHGGVVVAVDG